MKYTFLPLIATMLVLTSCTSNPYFNPNMPHHTKSGFRNVYYDGDDKGLLEFIRWRWERFAKDIPDGSDYEFEIDVSQHQIVMENTHRPSLTWIGHATFLIQLNGLNILTDPQFSERASPVSWAGPQRVVPPAIKLDELPEIDAVIISHDHYDSLDVQSVIRLSEHNTSRNITFIVPLGMKPWFVNQGITSDSVVELDWGQKVVINEVEFIAEPSQHWGKRTLFDTFKRLWASWVIDSGDYRVFFAGDTGYAKHFSDIGNKYGEFDLALLPIGAYEPRWFMSPFHVNPDESVKIHLDVKSKYSVAMHWGTFILTDESLDEPPVKLDEALKKFDISNSDFEVYNHGETRFLDE